MENKIIFYASLYERGRPLIIWGWAWRNREKNLKGASSGKIHAKKYFLAKIDFKRCSPGKNKFQKAFSWRKKIISDFPPSPSPQYATYTLYVTLTYFQFSWRFGHTTRSDGSRVDLHKIQGTRSYVSRLYNVTIH